MAEFDGFVCVIAGSDYTGTGLEPFAAVQEVHPGRMVTAHSNATVASPQTTKPGFPAIVDSQAFWVAPGLLRLISIRLRVYTTKPAAWPRMKTGSFLWIA